MTLKFSKILEVVETCIGAKCHRAKCSDLTEKQGNEKKPGDDAENNTAVATADSNNDGVVIPDEKDSSESMDVNQLRDELEAVQKQRSQSEKKRVAIDRQLVDAANNIKKIQQVSCLLLPSSHLL